MLTPLRENGEVRTELTRLESPLQESGLSLQEVCSQYWPEAGKVTSYGEYTVDNLGEESNPGFTMRQMSVLNKKVCDLASGSYSMTLHYPPSCPDSESLSGDPVPDPKLE